MSAAEVAISWDEHAAAWRLDVAPAGPAGTTAVELDGVSWRFDWLDPSVVVDAHVFVEGDAPEAPVPSHAVALVALLLGDEVARALVGLPGSGLEVRAPAPDDARRSNRYLAGRLAMALELADASESPVWWDVEAVAARLALGVELPEGLLERAFEVVDPAPLALLQSLADAGLADPVVQVLGRVGLAEHELPAPLRLSTAQVESAFEQLVSGLDLPVESLRGDLLAPVFRRSSGVLPGERAADWVDAPAGVLRRATWRMEGDTPVATLGASGPLPSWLGVRVVDVAGRAPVVLDEQLLRVTGTRDGLTTSTARLGPIPDGAQVRVEVADLRDRSVLSSEACAQRHAAELARAAATLERHADAEAKAGTERARETMRVAASQWSESVAAWEATDSSEHAEVCRQHAARLRALADGAAASSDGAAAGWTESVVAAAHLHLANSSAVGGTAEVDERRVAGLAALAEVSGELELAARFRSEQARALRSAESGGAIARLALRHFGRLGMRPPRDLSALGAPAG